MTELETIIEKATHGSNKRGTMLALAGLGALVLAWIYFLGWVAWKIVDHVF